MRWAALNTFGAGAWLLGLLYAKAPHAGTLAAFEGGGHPLAVGTTCAAIGAATMLWANLRSV